jgi:Glycosyl hydrolase catalytic core
MYANGIAGKFDGLAYHPYPWTYSRAMSQNPDSFWSGMSTAYSIMQSKGDGRKKIWITEYGYTTEYTNESTVQAYLNTDGADYKTKDFLATLCWFSDRDNGEGFGLSGSTFPLAHRPRWSTFQNIITTP